MTCLLVLVLAAAAAVHADGRWDRFPGRRDRRTGRGAVRQPARRGGARTGAGGARLGAEQAGRVDDRGGLRAAGVLVATWGTPVDGGIHPWLARAIAAGQRLGAPSWLGYSAVEFTANVVFFAPFGFLAVLLLGARGGGWGCSAGSCELRDRDDAALFLPARFASVDDVLANTSGAVLGVLLGVVVLGRCGRPERSLLCIGMLSEFGTDG